MKDLGKTDSTSGALKQELRIFAEHKKNWLDLHAGQFAVIGGTTIAGFYPDYRSAFIAGLAKFGGRDFLVKQVCAEEPVYFIF
jgi:hypothetical protein